MTFNNYVQFTKKTMHNGFRPDYELHIFARCAQNDCFTSQSEKMGISLESCDRLVHAMEIT